MRTTEEILELLPQLDQVVADDLEDQDLDFKEWSTRSMDDAVKLTAPTPCPSPSATSRKWHRLGQPDPHARNWSHPR